MKTDTTNTNSAEGADSLDRIVRIFREWRLRKAKEKAAYWKGKAETWRSLCSGQHNGFDREYLAEATGKWCKYQSRVDSLISAEDAMCMNAGRKKS